ncbi:4-hydroxybenzoyl-CoA thioesterase family active site [hydrothermal vent metagenome]|uniref:4-hydroxybenzoyl-CoA thioesterase family active site n=1 Tax=hydrothermal vent metagenome TaxID=652676 RepID=A0A1W1EE49_9ZZZZ
MKIRVYYEDTDAGGIVYHTNYIKFCERARSEAFFSSNMMPAECENSGFVVRNINADFFATSKLGDILTVKSKVLKTKNTSLVLLQEIYKEETKVFSMEVVLVYIDKNGPKRIPQQFKELFLNFT